ncbi:hypothetical protein [Nocardia sp. NRRL S-836]|uniref:hypothetical protein n=1 Tax=Nocardia sp. NRRL S-836 TaxID=1519492 RepID=UPI0006AEC1BB|nr:hypothetical protein [Nocardia sp. NRRL S-836]
MRFKKGFGPAAPVLWDTDWAPEQKLQQMEELPGGLRVPLLLDMTKKRNDPGVLADLNLLLDSSLQELDTWSRRDLHSLRASLPALQAQQHLPAVEDAVRAAVRPCDTGGLPPQKKTPAGKTRVIAFNYKTGQQDARKSTEFAHARFFADQARALKLGLRVLTTEAGQRDLLRDDVFEGLDPHWTIVDQVASEWAEDSVEYLQSGEVAVLEEFNATALRAGLVAGRQARWAALLDPTYVNDVFDPIASKQWVPEGLLVVAGKTREMVESALERQHRAARHLRFYAEGGNLIVGENAAGETIALVGRDSIAATAGEYLFANDNQVLELIAEDLGVAVQRVIPVEQPGKFHLDMGLLFVGEGVVLLNDSGDQLDEAEARLTAYPGDASRRHAAKLRLQCGLEALAERDLTAAGLTVHRRKLESGAVYNFFNGEFVADEADQVHYLTNGTGAEAVMQTFVSLLVDELKVAVAVHTSPVGAAEHSLESQGGVGCRIKGALSAH